MGCVLNISLLGALVMGCFSTSSLAFVPRRSGCVSTSSNHCSNNHYQFLFTTTTATTTTTTATVLASSKPTITDEKVAKSMQNKTAEGVKATGITRVKTPPQNATSVLALQQQAAALRAEIALLEGDLRASQEAKRQKELADIDRWIEECLYVSVTPSTSSGNGDNDVVRIELLNSVETAAQVLRDNRFSHEQVSKMFERICDTSPAQSRSNCSPLLALLVDAAGKLDCVERNDNPNKRWDGRVERDLRKRLFAMDWGIHLDPELPDNDRFV